MERPAKLNGMRHIALVVENLEEVEAFYTEILGMDILFRPHENLVYLTLGCDNLSLARAKPGQDVSGNGMLDHLGFLTNTREELDQWYEYLVSKGVKMEGVPHDHKSDPGVRSFYCLDPAGNRVQPLYHPAASGQTFSAPGQQK